MRFVVAMRIPSRVSISWRMMFWMVLFIWSALCSTLSILLAKMASASLKRRIGAFGAVLHIWRYILKRPFTLFSLSPTHLLRRAAMSTRKTSLPLKRPSCIAVAVLPVPGSPWNTMLNPFLIPLPTSLSWTFLKLSS